MKIKSMALSAAFMAALVFCGFFAAQSVLAEGAKKPPWTGRERDGRIITRERLNEILVKHLLWLRTNGDKGEQLHLNGAHLEKICLRYVLIQKAALYGAKLKGAYFRRCNLRKANFNSADLQSAHFVHTNLRQAKLNWANLNECYLEDADLSGAHLTGAKLKGATFRGVDLKGTVFEPKPGQLPDIISLVTVKNLSRMTYEKSPHGLVELREAFKKAGMRKQEREMTYAIKYNERIRGESWLWRKAQLVLFEFPVGWGLYPERALFIMAGLIPFFAVAYFFPLGLGGWRGGTIWMRWREGRATNLNEPDHPRTLKRRGWRRAAFALYFALLSAFHLGWRELNVGTWITRMQPREYTLQATGWTRVISGAQSLISVYLLALAVLSYFGRPFE